MDLLEQYKQRHPEAFQEKKPVATDPYGREYGMLIRLAIQLSRGYIRDARQANYALLTIAIVVGLAALLFFFGVPGSAPTQMNTINP